jgi:hypothetical protein
VVAGARRRTYAPDVLGPALAIVSALGIGMSPVAPLAGLSLGAFALTPPWPPELEAPARRAVPHAPLDGGGVAAAAALPSEERDRTGGPVCSGDYCQPAVSVPGFEPSYGRVHRSEAVVALLTRAHVEPLATMAWALVSTGLRVDWAPPAFDGPNVGARAGWGMVMVRLRLRIDANGAVTVPPRPR